MKYIYYLSLILLSLSTQAQYRLSGIIGMQGGELFSYDMIVTATKKPEIYTGTVKTYATQAQEVVAEIELTVDKSAKTVQLRETKITANTGFKSNTIICLVRADLTYDEKNGVLKGPILTQTTGDQAYCARGNVIFTNRNEIEALFGINEPPAKPVAAIEHPKTIEKTTPTKTTTPVVRKPKMDEPTPASKPAPIVKKSHLEVTEGKDQALQWSSDKVIIDVWDDNQIDGDRISIMVNGVMIEDNLLLQKDKSSYTVDISQHELSVILITAMSMGSEPPNTAMISLWDKDKEHLILSYNDIGKKSVIRIRRKL